MHRIDADGHVGNMFNDGAGEVEGTKADAAWLNAVQEEICNALEDLGVTLVKGDNDQLSGVITEQATGNTIVKRNASGNAAVADPSNSTDIANKRYVDALGLKAAVAISMTTGTPSKLSGSVNVGTVTRTDANTIRIPFSSLMSDTNYRAVVTMAFVPDLIMPVVARADRSASHCDVTFRDASGLVDISAMSLEFDVVVF